MMQKPRPYNLRQMPTSGDPDHICYQATLSLLAEQDQCGDYVERSIYVETQHQIVLRPRSARALARRLLQMADWADDVKMVD